MAPLRLSWSVEGKPVSVTVEAQTTTTDGDCSPRETNPKAAKSTSGSSSEDDVPVYLHCGNDSLSDEEVEFLFDSFDEAMLRGDMKDIIAIIEKLKAQRREDINDGLRCIKRRLLVFLNTDSGFF